METPLLWVEPDESVIDGHVGRCLGTRAIGCEPLGATEGPVFEPGGPVSLEGHWRDATDRPEDTVVVPPVDPGQGGQLDVFDRQGP